MSETDKTEQNSKIIKLFEELDTEDKTNGFLLENSMNKDPAKRFLAYCIKLGVIPQKSTNINDVINKIKPEYFEIAKKLYEDNTISPLDKLPKSDSATVKADIKRSYFLFNNYCKHYQVKNYEKEYEKGKEIPYRILVALAHSESQLSYTQGYDRYLFIAYTLALKFVEYVGLKTEDAESLAYLLTRKLLVVADFHNVLENPAVYDGFSFLDEKLEKYCPNTFKLLKKSGFSAFNYSMRWRLLFFSDEHEIDGALLIWDHFLMNMDNIDECFACVGASHVRQVKVTDDFTAVEKIQKFKNWNERKIVSEATLMQQGKPVDSAFSAKGIIISLSLLVLVAATFYVYKNRFNLSFKQ